MRIYKSFLIRCWLMEDAQDGVREVYDIEAFQSGEHARSANLDQVNKWIKEICHNARPERAQAADERVEE
ncbi:MAG: hypothetical protein ABR577_08715 [Pyrinomonadaceae bacterium]